MVEKRVKLVSVILTIGILLLLLLVGAANAFTLNFTIANNNIIKGDKANLNVLINLNENESINIKYVQLDLTKSGITTSCKFDSQGIKISGCAGIQIQKIVENVSFGYGYNQIGKISFNLTLDSNFYSAGTYKTKITIQLVHGKSVKPGPNLVILAANKYLAGCSVRANKGDFSINGIDYGEAKLLNFYIPTLGAAKSTGTIYAQKKGITAEYDFTIENVTMNTNSSALISVSGQYKIDLQQKQNASAQIYYDKINKKISIINSIISAQNLTIWFSHSC